MWVLAQPLRLRLFELLVDGPATASQLARRVGESRLARLAFPSPPTDATGGRDDYAGPFDPTDLTLIHGLNGQMSPPRTALIVPVSADGRPVGTLNLYHPAENAFGDYDRELLELIADRASSALYNSILFDRTRGDSLTDLVEAQVQRMIEEALEPRRRNRYVVWGDVSR